MAEKRPYDGDGARQPGTNDDGWRSDASVGSTGSGNVLGRKIATPRGMRGGKPPRPQPRYNPNATPQPVAGNTQGFGFSFGSGAAPPTDSNSAPQSSFNFKFDSPQPQQSSFNFGVPQAPPQQNSFQFTASTPANHPFQSNNQSNNPGFGSPAPNAGFQGSIFNLPPSAPHPVNSAFSNSNTFQQAPNVFGNQQPTNQTSFNFGSGNQASQPSSTPFAFGQSNNSNPGFGSVAKSTSAPTSFSQDNDDQMNDEQPPPSTSTSFGGNRQQNLFKSASQATTPAFSFGQTAASQAQTEGPKSAFTFGQTATSTKAEDTKSQPEASQKPAFNFTTSTPFNSSVSNSAAISTAQEPETTKPATTNIFASAFEAPKTTSSLTAPSLFGSTPSVPPLFGASTPASSATQDKTKPAPTQAETAKPMFSFGAPAASSTSQEEIKTLNTATENKSSPFSFKPATPKEQEKTEQVTINKPPVFNFGSNQPSLFSTSTATPISSENKSEQKTLPAFGASTTTASPFKMPEVPQASATSAPGTGLFSTPFNDTTKSASTASSSLFSTSSHSDPAKPGFIFKPSTGSAASPKKPLFSVPETSTNKATPNPPITSGLFGKVQDSQALSDSTIAASQAVTTTKPMLGSTTATEQAAPANKQLFGVSTTAQVTSAEPAPIPLAGFETTGVQHQDQASNKSSFSLKSVNQTSLPRPAANGIASKSPSSIVQNSSAINNSTSQSKNQNQYNKPPKDSDFPAGFTSQWGTLRTGDLPLDEVVDILFHEWIQQIDVPERSKSGMNINQRDDIDWSWKHNTIDAAWAYHVQELGSQDRNLLEVYRIVMKLKERVDRLYGKTWSKPDTLVSSKIFDERNIRKMMKRNVQMWEDGIRSEVKERENISQSEFKELKHDFENLKKRKAVAVDAEADQEQSNETTKRNKTNATAQPEAPTFAPFNEDEGSSDNDADAKQQSKTSETTKQLFSNTAITSGSGSTDSPFKSNIFSSSSSSSPQLSKTSQLFASIANKPVELSTPATTDPEPKRSLFDRISRDSNGEPVRDLESKPLFSFSAPTEPTEEDASEDEDEDEEPTIENTTSNIFAQSAGARAKETETGDHTWKPDSPIRFSKDQASNKRKSAESDESIKKRKTGEEEKAEVTPLFSMPKLIKTTGVSPGFTVSSQSTWKAPANPFGNFKSINEGSDKKKTDVVDEPPKSPPQVTLTAPSPQRPTPLFSIAQTSKSPPATAIATSSNAWTDFAKGLHSSSPAPSGASVFASLNTSLNPSRASSPALSAVSTQAGETDADDDEAPKEAQLDLGAANAGEEKEDLLFSVKSKAYEFAANAEGQKDWRVRGLGELRVLKSNDTGKVRAVLRQEGSARVLLNAGLVPSATYNLLQAKKVNFCVAAAEGVTRWFLQVGKEDDAKKLSEVFEENKGN